MAMTIRNPENHQEIFCSLKMFADKDAQSGAFIEGGYQHLYEVEVSKNRQLENELCRLKRRMSSYFDALDSL